LLGRTLGVVWGFPQEILGALYTAAGIGVGATIKIAHNGIVVDNPIQSAFGGVGSGLTLGHFMNIGGTDEAPAVNDEGSHTVGDHEEEHTYQSEITGVFYMPLHGLSMLLGLWGAGHNIHGASAFMERGPMSDPPGPWP
jgi:hypothetical protein